jgi:hypothetical protein
MRSSETYFYLRPGEQEYGPVTVDDLRRLAAEGTINSLVKIRHAKRRVWINALDWTELEIFRQQPRVIRKRQAPWVSLGQRLRDLRLRLAVLSGAQVSFLFFCLYIPITVAALGRLIWFYARRPDPSEVGMNGVASSLAETSARPWTWLDMAAMSGVAVAAVPLLVWLAYRKTLLSRREFSWGIILSYGLPGLGILVWRVILALNSAKTFGS